MIHEKDMILVSYNSFSEEVVKRVGCEEIRPCFSCYACTGVCPVREVVDDFDPRLIIHWISLDMKEKVLGSDLIWLCCLCNSCYHVCPQRISFRRIVRILRIMALEEGYRDEEFLKSFESMEKYLVDLCRRTIFSRIRRGFRGPHRLPCWRKETRETDRV